MQLERDMTVGRTECDITLEDHQVSRRHLVLRPVGSELQVEDLGSSNGTLVDGRRIAAPVTVGDGGVIRLGTSELIVKTGPPTVPGMPAVASLAGTPPAAAATDTAGGLPRWLWTVIGVVEVAVILTTAVLLVSYAA